MRAADIGQRNARFVTIARDPRIVHGLYRYCDEWCEQCAATERCLLLKCRKEITRDRRGGRALRRLKTSEEAALQRQLEAAEPPTDAAQPVAPAPIVDVAGADALVAVALEYAARSSRFVEEITRARPQPSSRGRPAPCDVIRRFQSAIYAQTTRALVAATLAASGMPAWRGDAVRSSARVLAYAARSRAALELLFDTEDRRTLISMLDRIVDGLGRHFPDVMVVHLRTWPTLSRD